jgi:hypothetical protein
LSLPSARSKEAASILDETPEVWHSMRSGMVLGGLAFGKQGFLRHNCHGISAESGIVVFPIANICHQVRKYNNTG